ncbi:MAG TPA: glycosyltransferase, partial [Longimicrobiales bacterium]|nr:glycosyltransferase [Longimicrobiales bacterium]
TVTTVSEAVRAGVESLASGRVRTQVIPNVVDDRVFRPGLAEARVPDRILFVGAIRRVKGFDILVRAIPEIVRHRSGVHVEVVGEPYYAAYRKDAADDMRLARELGVADRIHFVGPTTPEGVARAMEAASVLAVPSRRESFSAVTAEALACGTPVVATRCGGPEEIIGEGMGEVVSPGSPSELARALLDVLSRPEAFDPSELHADMVRRFGRTTVAGKLEALYADVLDRATR